MSGTSVVTNSDLAASGPVTVFQGSSVEGVDLRFIFNGSNNISTISDILSGESLSTTTSGVDELVLRSGNSNGVTISGTTLILDIGSSGSSISDTIDLYVTTINGASNLSFTATRDGDTLKLASSSVSLLTGTVGSTNVFFLSTSLGVTDTVVAGQVFTIGTIVQFDSEGYIYFGASTLTTT